MPGMINANRDHGRTMSMSDYYDLKKAAKSIDKDYKNMEAHTPAMNKSTVEKNKEPFYDPSQSYEDALHDAKSRFGERQDMNENVFLWSDIQNVGSKTEKYKAFSNKDNKELQNYSARYTNHSARKRASASEKAKSRYEKYNIEMSHLSEMAEEIAALGDMNTPEAFKKVKEFFKQSLKALNKRESAMKASAEVKSTSKADERFRKAKITRMILAQKHKLAQKYLDKYKGVEVAREMEEFFQKQCDDLQEKLVWSFVAYKEAYIAARGSVNRVEFEEIAPVKDVVNVKNDTIGVQVTKEQIRKKFGNVGTNQWRKKIKKEQLKACKNENLNSIRTTLEEVSKQQGNKYENQLNKIGNLIGVDSDGELLKIHKAKGHSYSKNNEIVYRFDLFGTGGSVDMKVDDVGDCMVILHNSLNYKYASGHEDAERKAYFRWLKNIKKHESVINFNPEEEEEYTDEFRENQSNLIESNPKLVAEFVSYKYYGKNNEDQSLAEVNRGIRVKQAEHNVYKKPEEVIERPARELVTIQGCEYIFDGGKFRIEAVAEYMRELAKKRLTPVFEKWKNGTCKPKTIHFMMDGVSRGGVNVSLGAMAINGWVSEEYPQYLKYVKYDLIQRDPVPGPNFTSVKDSIRIDGVARSQELDENGYIRGTKYKPLSKKAANSTVFYTFHPNVGFLSPFFQPQRVYDANRIILSPFRHADDGKISGIFTDIMQSKGQSRPMLNNSNGEFYAGSGVSDLDDGVYILDEYSTLTKLNSYEDAVRVFDNALKDTKYSRRKNRILEVIKDWFIEHSGKQRGNIENGE